MAADTVAVAPFDPAASVDVDAERRAAYAARAARARAADAPPPLVAPVKTRPSATASARARPAAATTGSRAAYTSRAARRAERPDTGAPASGPVEAAVAYALAQVGDRYVHGAVGPNAFDCSGLIVAAFARIGVVLPHFTGALMGKGRAVGRSELRRGDLVFPEPGHVAIYLGGNRIVHSANSRTGVIESELYDFWAARRVA